MKSLNLLVALIGLYINPVSAGCFRSGAKWEDREVARQHALDVCIGDGAVFDRRWIQGGKIVKKCIQQSPTQRIEFSVGNNEFLTAWGLDPDLCVKGFHNVINRCSRGGAMDAWVWTFRADPNKGTCEEARP
ncbi:uncharacterized protein FTJAE_6996 [Fusarium tjaetaba]|uniref:Secreted protein n=1 Tax=Fusarium tjaetaba TaxID=1567544 RepID=A0A8H5VTH2_9HYPO|nr:uncharacterized protein FTJAE_6996 [Fusarium tjaetaba]KAF5633845.1 hypothetical protein FTJAE_6996 [Fusarium tjaetaba]